MPLNKRELKKQLKELGFKVEGNYVHMRKRIINAEDTEGTENTKKTYYKADWFAELDTKKPTIKQKTSSKKPEDWFETEKEALSLFLEAQNTAKKRAVEIEKELDSLKKKLGFEIGYQMEGDTHGIYEDYLFINIKVDGYTFHKKIEED